MIHLDDALQKIVNRLPSTNKKSALNSMLIPLLSKVKDERESKQLLIIKPQNFINFLMQDLQIQLNDKELYCLLLVLVRDPEKSQMENEEVQQNNNEAKEDNGFILYNQIYTLVKNYLQKEKIVSKSADMGIDYRVLTKPTFEFLLKLKQEISGQETSSQVLDDQQL